MLKLLSLLMATELLFPCAQAPKPKASSFDSHVQCYEEQMRFNSNIEEKISNILYVSLDQPFTVATSNNNVTIKIFDEDYVNPTSEDIQELNTYLKDEYKSLCGVIDSYLESQDVTASKIRISYLSKDGTKMFQTEN